MDEKRLELRRHALSLTIHKSEMSPNVEPLSSSAQNSIKFKLHQFREEKKVWIPSRACTLGNEWRAGFHFHRAFNSLKYNLKAKISIGEAATNLQFIFWLYWWSKSKYWSKEMRKIRKRFINAEITFSPLRVFPLSPRRTVSVIKSFL